MFVWFQQGWGRLSSASLCNRLLVSLLVSSCNFSPNTGSSLSSVMHTDNCTPVASYFSLPVWKKTGFGPRVHHLPRHSVRHPSSPTKQQTEASSTPSMQFQNEALHYKLMLDHLRRKARWCWLSAPALCRPKSPTPACVFTQKDSSTSSLSEFQLKQNKFVRGGGFQFLDSTSW